MFNDVRTTVASRQERPLDIPDSHRTYQFRLETDEKIQGFIYQDGQGSIFSDQPVQIKLYRGEKIIIDELIQVQQLENMKKTDLAYWAIMNKYKPWLETLSVGLEIVRQEMIKIKKELKIRGKETDEIIAATRETIAQSEQFMAQFQEQQKIDNERHEKLIQSNERELNRAETNQTITRRLVYLAAATVFFFIILQLPRNYNNL